MIEFFPRGWFCWIFFSRWNQQISKIKYRLKSGEIAISFFEKIYVFSKKLVFSRKKFSIFFLAAGFDRIFFYVEIFQNPKKNVSKSWEIVIFTIWNPCVKSELWKKSATLRNIFFQFFFYFFWLFDTKTMSFSACKLDF